MIKVVGIFIFSSFVLYILWLLIQSIFKDTSDYKAGKPCITFDFFLSLYKVNPDRWHLRDFGNSIGYKTEEWQTFGTDVYWKTNKDRRKYFRWLKGELKRKAQEESNKVIKTISEQGLKDIENLKKEIKNVTMNELMRIEAERDRYCDFYTKLLEKRFSSIVPPTPFHEVPSMPALTGKENYYIYSKDNKFEIRKEGE
ncbi:MAG: hypothetical protein J6S85_17650 [Methanobrevibacter sp.]|nr:hypothetical protein [Methanobrevibacter sp.]